MRLVPAFALVALCAFLSASAAAQPTAPPGDAQGDADAVLASLRETVLYARYREAVPRAQTVLARGDLTARQRNLALELLATAQIATRDQAGAQQTLATLYSRDPGHRLTDPEASPPVQSAFARARGAEHTPVDVRLELTSPPRASRRESPAVVVHVASNVDAVEELRLSYRQPGESRFTRVTMALERDGSAHAQLPSPAGRDATQIGFFVEAVAPSLTTLATLGSAAEPRMIEISAAEPTTTTTTLDGTGADPILGSPTGPGAGGQDGGPRDEGGGGSVLGQWWFWTIVGAALIAGGVTAYVLLGPPSEQPSGTLGFVQLGLGR